MLHSAFFVLHMAMTKWYEVATLHICEVRPRKDKHGVDLISDALPFGRLWYDGPKAVANAIGYAEHRSRSHHGVIRVYDESGNEIEKNENKGEFRGVVRFLRNSDSRDASLGAV